MSRRPPTVLFHVDDSSTDARTLIAPIVERVTALERRIGELERAKAQTETRDAADLRVRVTLPKSTRALAFGAAELLRHAEVDPELRAALLAADLVSPHDVGVWLRRMRGSSDGILIERAGRHGRDGR